MDRENVKSGVKSLTSTTMIYAVGNLASKMISFVLIFFTTYYLSKEDLGVYDIILTTAALVAPLLYVQLTDAILRWLLTDNSSLNTSKVFTNIFCIIFVNTLIFSALYFVIINFVEIQNKWIVLFLLLTSTTLPLLQMFSRGNGKNTLFAVSGVVYSIIYTILTILLLVVFKLKVDGVLYANIAANIGTFLFIYIAGKYYLNFDIKQFDYSFCKELIFFSFPLIPNALAWWLFSSANRYVVLYFLGLELSGIWSISYKIPTITSIFTSIFFMAWQEKSIKIYDDPERDKYYTDILNTYVSLSLGIIIVLTAASKPMLYYLVEKSFFVSWKYTVFLMMATFFQSLALFYGVGYYCVKDTKNILYTTLIGSLSTIIFSIIFVPYFQLYGAGIATIIGFLIMFLIRMKQTRKYFTVSYPLQTTLYMAAGIALCYLVSFIDSVPMQILNNLSAATVAFYINRKFILSKLNQLKALVKLRLLHV